MGKVTSAPPGPEHTDQIGVADAEKLAAALMHRSEAEVKDTQFNRVRRTHDQHTYPRP